MTLSEYTYKEFEDWFNEVEGFTLRSERFYESMTQFSDNAKNVNIEIWMRAAFECGRKQNEN